MATVWDMLPTYSSTHEETKAQRGLVTPPKAAQCKKKKEERSNTSPSCKAQMPRSLCRDRKKVGTLESEAGTEKSGKEVAGLAIPASAVYLFMGFQGSE